MAKSMNSVRKCHRCRAWIPRERLEALPDTWLCETCSQEIDGEKKMGVVTENLAKPGSMKKNEGGATPIWVRKKIDPKD